MGARMDGKADWEMVPMLGATVKADHPITCLNPDETFVVTAIHWDRGQFFARGEQTMWFSTRMLSPAQPKH